MAGIALIAVALYMQGANLISVTSRLGDAVEATPASSRSRLDPRVDRSLARSTHIDHRQRDPLRHVAYDPAALTMQISFHLADTATGERRTAYDTFRLDTSHQPPTRDNPPQRDSTLRDARPVERAGV